MNSLPRTDASEHEPVPASRLERLPLHAAPMALCLLNEQGGVADCNPALARLLHCPPSSLQGRPIQDLALDEAQGARLHQAWQDATTQDIHEARQIWLSTQNHGPVLVDLHFTRAPQGDGPPAWVVALVDQTRHHREHQALLAAHEALQSAHLANQELALLADRSPNAVMICDQDMRIRWVNPSFTQTTGYTLMDALAQHPQLLLGPADSRAETLAMMTQRLQRGEAITRAHLPRVTRTGTPYWAEVSVMPIRDDAGQIARHLVIEQDITERVRSEAEREALMRIEASQAARTEFLSRMSHNMRTPLNAVMGFSHLLLRGAQAMTEDPHRHKVEIIEQAGQQLLSLVDQALQLAQLEGTLEDYAPEAVDLSALVRECIEPLQERARQKGIQIRLTVPAIRAMGDARRIREIVHHLLSNALKFTPGPGTIQVTATLDAATHLVALRVQDPGVGIPSEAQSLIFQPFTRLDGASDMAPGHGIGLAMARRLAELMLGDLSVQSQPGQGSTFTLTLPAADDPTPAQATRGALTDPSPEDWRLPPLHLLCVEDNTLNRLLIEAVFSHDSGVQLQMAATLGEGIHLVNAHMPDVILLDINLPDGNGLSLARLLRHNTPPEQRPLVIALSADALPESIHEAMAAGADHYLVKPLQIARLLGILKTHFRV